MRRAAKETSNDEYHHAPRFLAGRGLVLGEDRRVGLEGVPVEQDGEVRITVCNELVGYVRSGFLQDDCVESSQVAAMICMGFLRAGPGFHCRMERRN